MCSNISNFVQLLICGGICACNLSRHGQSLSEDTITRLEPCVTRMLVILLTCDSDNPCDIHLCVHAQLLSPVQSLVTLGTVAHQVLGPWEFSSKNIVAISLCGIFPDPGFNLISVFPHW